MLRAFACGGGSVGWGQGLNSGAGKVHLVLGACVFRVAGGQSGRVIITVSYYVALIGCCMTTV